LSLAWLAAPAGAARGVDRKGAQILVESLIDAVEVGVEVGGEVGLEREVLDAWLAPAALEGRPEAMREAYLSSMLLRLGPQGDLGSELAGREVAGVVSGPGYARVVLEGAAPLTVVVRRDEGGLAIDRIERSRCALCAEPERFVVDLLADVAAGGGGRWRLTVGRELLLPETIEGADPEEWRRAMDRRNVHAAYLRWALRDAAVVGSRGDEVTVRLREGGEETWTVVFGGTGWAVDYAALPADSVLRLDPADTALWRQEDYVSEAAARWWLPLMRGEEPTLLAGDVIFAGVRRGQGELVIYTQNLGRTTAMGARIDPQTGEVLGAWSMPRLGIKLMVIPHLWRSLFSAALSPDGRHLAVAIHNQLQVADVETGEWRYVSHELGGAGGVAWSQDGAWLAAGGEGGSLLLVETEGWQVRARAGLGEACMAPVFWDGGLAAVSREGRVARFSLPDLLPAGEGARVCCGAPGAAAVDPAGGGLMVSCTASCAPVWRWELPPTGSVDPPAAIADERLSAAAGALGTDPTGRWRLAPSAEGGAALVNTRTGEVAATFSAAPLVYADWSDDGDWLYGVDSGGRLWRWSVGALVGRGRQVGHSSP
jgi:hypothetical protein